MTSRLVIARHGNTFDSGAIARRVGARTDLPLSESGRAQAQQLGAALARNGLVPDTVYAAPLRRTRQTAALALSAMAADIAVQLMPELTEIDYGPDEGQPEADVIARIGEQALRDWDENNIVPQGWQVDPVALRAMWQTFADTLLAHAPGQTALCVTSNGIARFALDLMPTGKHQHSAKLATAAYGVLEHGQNGWQVMAWNRRD